MIFCKIHKVQLLRSITTSQEFIKILPVLLVIVSQYRVYHLVDILSGTHWPPLVFWAVQLVRNLFERFCCLFLEVPSRNALPEWITITIFEPLLYYTSWSSLAAWFSDMHIVAKFLIYHGSLFTISVNIFSRSNASPVSNARWYSFFNLN